MSDLAFSTLTELASGLRAGRFSAEEIIREYLARIALANARLGAYVSVDESGALQGARAADARRASGHSLGPLDGLPLALKDLCEIEGQLTSVGSQAWLERRSTITATAVQRLLQAGMVVLGKTHMVEFAFGGWGLNPVRGTPRNPWDLGVHRIPGGSSSGSGVAVAAGLAPAALGSDTGGSVRIPASLNGITGLKTTRGLISLYGAFPLSGTLDTIGPLTRSVEDAALLTQAMAGADARDPSTARAPIFRWSALADQPKPLAGMRIVRMPAAQFPMAVAPDVLRVFDETQRVMRDLGAELVERELPFDFNDMMLRNGQIIAAEAFALHRAYIDDPKLPFGPWTRKRVQSGRSISAADYIDALAHQRATVSAWTAWMGSFDAVLTPCLPFAACPLEEVDEARTPLAAFTRAGNYLGACGMSLPAGMSDRGLPIGMQWLGKPFDEATLVRLGMAFQRATDWHRQRPDLSEIGL